MRLGCGREGRRDCGLFEKVQVDRLIIRRRLSRQPMPFWFMLAPRKRLFGLSIETLYAHRSDIPHSRSALSGSLSS